MHFTTQWPSHEMGDITLGWTEDQAAMMEDVIGKKMAEGFTFFIIDDAGREVRLRKIGDLKGRAAVTIGDKEAELLIQQGKIGIVDVSGMAEAADSEQPQAKPGRRARNAKEAAAANTVATRPMKGG